jgi:hypothetical protein
MRHMGKAKTKTVPQKKRITKRTAKKRERIKSPTEIDFKIRSCIADEIAVAKRGRKSLTKSEARKLFDDAFKKCLKQSQS